MCSRRGNIHGKQMIINKANTVIKISFVSTQDILQEKFVEKDFPEE